jgi:fatty acid desaturase
MALAQRPLVNDYAELKQRIKQQGLLEQQPVYYTYKMLFTLALLALSIACLVVFRHSWFQLLNAVFLAFVFSQIGFLGHDVGHRQVFRSPRLFELTGFVTGNLLLGWSWSWWVEKHNRHHAHPNEEEVDPDISIPLLAFTEQAAREKRGFLRFMVKHQAYFYLPLELLGWLSFLIFSTSFLLQKKAKYGKTEAVLMTIHYLLYCGLLFSCLTVWQALLFFVIHRALFGLYLGSVAAPNHKGMLVTDQETELDFLHQQVLSSRNVRPNPVTDFWYGGLNYQIEHHLFPTIPRNKLGEARRIVKAFCEEHAIPYHETGFLQSYREIFQYLSQVSAPLRVEHTS